MYARRMRSFFPEQESASNSARMNKSNFTTEKIVSVHILTVFEIVGNRNDDNWIQLLT